MQFFDFVDIIVENAASPFILMFISHCCNPTVTPQVDLCSFFILIACDLNVHSMDPYTVTVRT